MAMGALLRGLGLGAGLMYFWDPRSGRRRRSLVLDQCERTVHCTRDYFEKAQRDANNRLSGLAAQAHSLIQNHDANDRVVTARVRSKLGRHCSRPHAVKVEAYDGHVILSGTVKPAEVGEVLRAVCGVAGVRGVENQLEVRPQEDNGAAGQGGITHRADAAAMATAGAWPPATRVASQLAGAALMGNCLASDTLTSKLLGVVGLGLFVRATTNRSLDHLLGNAPGSQVMRFQRTISIHAPLERVWDFLSDFEQVARFLPIVNRVESLGGGHYRWAVSGLGGQVVEGEERITEFVPHERLSWESVAEEPFAYCGTCTLHRDHDDSTRVHLCVDYSPPGGALTAGLASLLGLDIKTQFQEAVMRIKPFLEQGHVPHHLKRDQSGRIDSAVEREPASGPGDQAERREQEEHQARLDRLSEMGEASSTPPPPPSPSPALKPDQIPTVHAETQPAATPTTAPDSQERGRLG